MVAEFITPTKEWDIAKLREYVLEGDVRIIATIPISSINDEDKWIWHYSKNGAYSVKSGYKLAMMSIDGLGSTSDNTQNRWWNILWKSQVPSKVKLFIWKAFHECLPTNFCL